MKGESVSNQHTDSFVNKNKTYLFYQPANYFMTVSSSYTNKRTHTHKIA